jgi:uncharacterized protein DUF6489
LLAFSFKHIICKITKEEGSTMKINVEVDITPEELRRFMGLPDVHDMQQNLIDQFSSQLQSSAEQRDEFLKGMFKTAMGPWQTFANVMSNPPKSTSKPGQKD